jgi:DNA-binding response OmpR family regulator
LTINLLVIEDDEIVARTIERGLRRAEFKVSVANSGVEGLKTARRAIPDLVILDVMMPGMDGYTVCREMRADPLLTGVPILFLTAKIKNEDKITGFVAGADDYLTKPFNLDELILRIQAIVRRARSASHPLGTETQETTRSGDAESRSPESSKSLQAEGDQCIVVAGYILDSRSYELHTPHRGKIRLTPVQYDLLYHLMSHPGQIFSPESLLDDVWDYPSDTGSSDLVRVHIKNLRERIELDPSSPTFIRTIPGYGYTVNPDLLS